MLDRTRYKLPASFAGKRLDRVLAELIPEESQAWLQKLVRRGGVQRNGGVVTRSLATVAAGDVLDVDFSPGSTEYELPILFQDEHVAVINKPAGLMVHRNERTSGDTVGTLAAKIWSNLPKLRGAHRPGIVHRLDRETSGVMLIAKTEPAMKALLDAFAKRRVTKTYEALAHAEPPSSPPAEGAGAAPPSPRVDEADEFTVEARLIADPGHVDLQILAAADAGRDAQTRFRILERLERGARFLHVACYPRTGRRHQIRVHLLSRGHPIVGDRLYGSTIGLAPEAAPWPARQALHARRLGLAHPILDEELTVEAPWPEDLERMRRWAAAGGDPSVSRESSAPSGA